MPRKGKIKNKVRRAEKSDTKIRIKKIYSKEITARAVLLEIDKMRLVSLLAVLPFKKLTKLVDKHLRNIKKPSMKKKNNKKRTTEP
jgi:hypothetical protein